jgi:hypothetical protein
VWGGVLVSWDGSRGVCGRLAFVLGFSSSAEHVAGAVASRAVDCRANLEGEDGVGWLISPVALPRSTLVQRAVVTDNAALLSHTAVVAFSRGRGVSWGARAGRNSASAPCHTRQLQRPLRFLFHVVQLRGHSALLETARPVLGTHAHHQHASCAVHHRLSLPSGQADSQPCSATRRFASSRRM